MDVAKIHCKVNETMQGLVHGGSSSPNSEASLQLATHQFTPPKERSISVMHCIDKLKKG